MTAQVLVLNKMNILIDYTPLVLNYNKIEALIQSRPDGCSAAAIQAWENTKRPTIALFKKGWEKYEKALHLLTCISQEDLDDYKSQFGKDEITEVAAGQMWRVKVHPRPTPTKVPLHLLTFLTR